MGFLQRSGSRGVSLSVRFIYFPLIHFFFSLRIGVLSVVADPSDYSLDSAGVRDKEALVVLALQRSVDRHRRQ